MPGVTSPAAIMCGWLSGAGCASTRRCEKALCQAAPGLRKPDARLMRVLRSRAGRASTERPRKGGRRDEILTSLWIRSYLIISATGDLRDVDAPNTYLADRST